MEPAILLNGARASFHYEVEGHILEFTEAVVARMAALKISRAKLAAEMKVNPSYITNVLRGRPNISIETMVKFARALKMELKIK